MLHKVESITPSSGLVCHCFCAVNVVMRKVIKQLLMWHLKPHEEWADFGLLMV